MSHVPAEAVHPATSPAPRPGAEPRRGKRKQALRVCVFTTSYPRHERDPGGSSVANLVAHLRARGIDVDVVCPSTFRDFGLGDVTGAAIDAGLAGEPSEAVIEMAAALRRAARDADLVHAHWLAGALVARLAGLPFVATLHDAPSAGNANDLELLEGAPDLARETLTPARSVICVSHPLADAVRRLGIRDTHVILPGTAVRPVAPGPDEPPFVLYVGRLADEYGVDVLAQAAFDLPLVVVGDGPRCDLYPEAIPFQPPEDVDRWYERAAVVVAPFRKHGPGSVFMDAMAHGRPVIGSTGITTLIDHGRTGLLVSPGNAAALRGAIRLLLDDAELRSRLGAAAREQVVKHASWEVVTEQTLAVYRAALSRPHLELVRNPGAAVSPREGSGLRLVPLP